MRSTVSCANIFPFCSSCSSLMCFALCRCFKPEICWQSQMTICSCNSKSINLMGLTGSDYVKQCGNKLRMGSIPNSVIVVVMLHTGQGQGLTLYAAQFSPTPQSTYKMPFLMPRREGFANSFIISILCRKYVGKTGYLDLQRSRGLWKAWSNYGRFV